MNASLVQWFMFCYVYYHRKEGMYGHVGIPLDCLPIINPSLYTRLMLERSEVKRLPRPLPRVARCLGALLSCLSLSCNVAGWAKNRGR